MDVSQFWRRYCTRQTVLSDLDYLSILTDVYTPHPNLLPQEIQPCSDPVNMSLISPRASSTSTTYPSRFSCPTTPTMTTVLVPGGPSGLSSQMQPTNLARPGGFESRSSRSSRGHLLVALSLQ